MLEEKQLPSQAPVHSSPCYMCYVHHAIDFSQQPYEEVLRLVPFIDQESGPLQAKGLAQVTPPLCGRTSI